MTIRGYIEIRLENGDVVTYVNSTVQDTLGKNGLFYSYSNESGDEYINQTGAGKLKGDYDTLVAQIGGTGAITWPEGGTELIRKNTNNSVAANSKVIRTVSAAKVVSMVVIEQEINEFQQLDLDRNSHY